MVRAVVSGSTNKTLCTQKTTLTVEAHRAASRARLREAHNRMLGYTVALFLAAPVKHATVPELAELADKYATDKSLTNGHAYVSLYSMLLEPHREAFRNVTEIGVLLGASELMWAKYFPNAHVWGLDIRLDQRAVKRCASEPRIHLFEADAHDANTPAQLGLANESMDLVVEDASHSRSGTHMIAAAFWPLVKPGGFYVIEDVNTGGDANGKYSHGASFDEPGFAQVAHNASGALRDIYLNNDVFFADTMVGVDFAHSAFASDQKRKRWLLDSVNHNWHLVVIRKRHPSSSRTSHVGSEHAGHIEKRARHPSA